MLLARKLMPDRLVPKASVQVATLYKLFRSAYPRVVIAVGGIVLVVSIWQLIAQPINPVWLALTGLTLLTGWATLRMPVAAASFSVSDAFTITAALLFGPAAGTVLVTIDALMMSSRLPRGHLTGLRLLFNATAPALAMWLSAQAFFAMTGTGPLAAQPAAVRDVIGRLAFFAAMYFLLNTGFVATAVALERERPVVRVWREHFSMLWLTFFGGASIAGLVLLMMAARVGDAVTLVLVAPLLVLLYITFSVAIERVRDKLEHLAKMSAYAAALRSTADAVLVTDSNGRITLMNPAAERLTGWSEQNALGRPEGDVLRLVDAASVASHASGDRSAGLSQPAAEKPDIGDSSAREFVLVRLDGSECPVEHVQAPVRDDEGNVIGGIRAFRDVTRRKAIEAEREGLLRSERHARQAADDANRMKDEFLATLSHELRTPATAVLGWTRLLKSGRLDETETRQALDALERNARAQAAVLNDLLDTSRIIRGALRLDMRRLDVLEPLREAIGTIEPAMRAKNIQLRLDAVGEIPQVQADPDRLRQVFWNLLSNAVKFTDERGSIDVTVSGEPGHVRVEVVDNGRGIQPDVLPYIFDRFRQGDSSTTRQHAGLGLGLAIVRHLVESHGGTVTAASEGEGRGARFTVRLPTAIRRRATDRMQAAS